MTELEVMDRTHDRPSFDGALLGGGVLVGLGRMHAHGARPRSMLMVIFSTRYRDVKFEKCTVLAQVWFVSYISQEVNRFRETQEDYSGWRA